VAATAALGPLLPPRSFAAGEGARVANNASALAALLAQRDALHLVAFRSWVKEGGDALWRIVEHVLERAAAGERAAGSGTLQQDCIQRLVAGGVSGLWDGSGR
jgi:hypothetical protein